MMKMLKKFGRAYMNGLYAWGAAITNNGKILVNI